MTDEVVAGYSQTHLSGQYEDCKACGEQIRTMVFKGADYCSDNCRKRLEQNGDCK